MSTMNKRRKRYAELRSMAELHKERRKLRRMMKANEADLAEDRDDIMHMISPANILDELMCRISVRSAAFRNVVAGIRVVTSLIRGRRRSCGC